MNRIVEYTIVTFIIGMKSPLTLSFLSLIIFLVKGKDYILDTPEGKLKVCDNAIVRDIPGDFEAVLNAGKLYVESIKNLSTAPMEPFRGLWKWEMFRIFGPLVPECSHLTVFGDEKKNYDEAKRFCQVKKDDCLAYSIGSCNEWGFEEMMYNASNCRIETMDCTVNGSIPTAIADRTRFHKIYSEYHLDRESHGGEYIWHRGHNEYNGHVGPRLRKFFDHLFIKGGYMGMHLRTAVMKKNADVLLAKVFCHIWE